ncbi:cell surface glycoprotein MUC18 isoform X2 [Pantherophis guttatus]|uniref:Cell surface glycoprotein MUC18 isoform X2 n=1 Tax=Pantherophis guttatus TaxID=94885 RepID=A0ABM3ZRM0_PANGU|nr:cell surface glycoprotein MUC18 isoform X2 [Pantherophis guttatus]
MCVLTQTNLFVGTEGEKEGNRGHGDAETNVEVSMPDVVEAEIGETAVIDCEFSLPENSSYTYINWFSGEKMTRKRLISLIQDKEDWAEDQYRDRLNIAKNFSLVIKKVTPQDAKLYICQVGLGSLGVGENRTKLQVSKAPELPEFQLAKDGFRAAEPTLQEIATCTARNGFPAPSIVWYKNREALQPKDEETGIHATVITESSGLITIRSMLSARVAKEDREAQFHCQVNYTLMGKNKTAVSESFRINVLYATQNLSFTLDQPNQELKEGDNATLVCEGDGNPPPEYTLFKTEDSQYSSPDGKMLFPSVMRNDSGLYWCKALDLHTLEELIASVDLMVNYLDVPTIFPAGPQQPAEGEDLVLTCSTTGSGPLKFQWQKKGKLIADGAVLNLTFITYEKMGNYTCVVTMPDFPGWVRSRHIFIAVRAKPQKVHLEQNLGVREGEVVDLTCSFYSVPRMNISWSTSNSTVHTSRRKNHYNSTLSVLVTKEILKSGLNCTGENELGSENQHFPLWLKTKEHPDKTETITQESKGVIIVAVIVCLLLFAVLGAVLYFLHKKGKLACGRSGKQEITRPEAHKDEIVVEVKSDKLPEEAGLLQGANGEKRSPGDQGANAGLTLDQETG